MLFLRKKVQPDFRITVDGHGKYRIEHYYAGVYHSYWGLFNGRIYHTQDEAMAVIDDELKGRQRNVVWEVYVPKG